MSADGELKHTYCLMCSSRCAVTCRVKDGMLIEVLPDLDHPLGGTICVKAMAAPEFVADPQRLRYPMKRTRPKDGGDPGWERISWDEAMSTIAERLSAIKAESGAHAAVFYRPAPGGSGAGDYHLWMMRLGHAFGTTNLAMTTHVCNWHRDEGSSFTYGRGVPAPDYDNAGCVLVWGTNPHNTNQRHAHAIDAAVARGAKLIVADPRKIPLAGRADVWLQVEPGADLPLLLGLINRMLAKGCYDAAFLARWSNASFLIREDTGAPLTEVDIDAAGGRQRFVVQDAATGELAIYDPARVGYTSDAVRPALDVRREVTLADGGRAQCRSVLAALRDAVADYTPERTEALTGVPAASIEAAADLIGASGPLCHYTWNGIEQHTDAMQTNRALCILFALTGFLDRKGGMVRFPPIPVKGEEQIVGIELVPKEAGQVRLGAKARPLGPAGGPTWFGAGAVQSYDIYEAILTGEPYRVRALVSFGGNIMGSNADSARGAEALRALEFYAHVDLYENPSARYADILLPAASVWESEVVGALRWNDRAQAQLRRKIIEPGYERRGDLEIIFDLAHRLGLDAAFFGGSVTAAMEDMLSPLGMTLSQLRETPRGVPLQRTPVYEKYALPNPQTGVPRGVFTPSRLVEIYSLAFAAHGYDPLPVFRGQPEREVDRAALPLIFTSGKSKAYTHGTYRSVPRLRALVPEPYLYLHPDAATARGIREGDWVMLETPKGRIRLKARLDAELSPHVVAGEEGWWQACEALGLPGYDPLSETGANLNLLIGDDAIDPITGSIPLRGQPCQVFGA